MPKRCSTPSPCHFDHHCAHRQVPQHLCNGFFWPTNTGEACQQSELQQTPSAEKWGDGADRRHHRDEPDDLVERLARMAGAHD